MWRAVVCVVGVGWVALAGGGCQSVWAKNFQPDVRVRGRTFAPTAAVSVRVVEPARLERFYGEMKTFNETSAVAYDDLPAGKKSEIDDRFYEALQLPERSPRAVLVG